MGRIIGFDWDGTLMDSMLCKAKCFAETLITVYPELSGKDKELIDLYLASRGNPRFRQLSLAQQRFKLRPLEGEERDLWSDQFTKRYLTFKLPLFPDALAALEHFKDRGFLLFLSSSVPQADLQLTLESYPQAAVFFEEVLGTRDGGRFRKGPPHLGLVAAKYSEPPNNIVFVGDAPDDVLGAKAAGCIAVGKVDSRIPGAEREIRKAQPDLIIYSLAELTSKF